MERFEFDSKTGSNANPKNGLTRRGAVELYPDFVKEGLASLDIRGPVKAYRGAALLDKATAGKLGAALLKWAMPNNNAIRVHLATVLAAYEAVTEANK